MTRRKTVQLTDGEWFDPPMRGHREMCCDCGLVHDVDYVKRARGIRFRATRNEKATAAARKRFGFRQAAPSSKASS